MRAFKDEAIAKIRAQVGNGKVICGLSGGVDSSRRRGADPRSDRRPAHLRVRRSRAAAARRSREGRRAVPRRLQHPARFMSKPKRCSSRELEGVDDPEAKRKIIGRLFIDVFDAEAKKLGGADFLAQGTLYPDVIESVSFTGGPSVTIKSHHNVGGLPERMNMKLVEPLRELFKDEVRALGRELGLAGRVRRPPSVSGAGPCDPLSRRDHPREARHSAPCRRRSISRKSAATAFTTTSGRPSR